LFGAYFRALASLGDTLFVAGQADSLGGMTGSYLAALSTSTAARLDWDPRPNCEICTLATSGGDLYAGGIFNSMNDWVARRNLAAIDATTGALTAWAPEPDDYVEANPRYAATPSMSGGSSPQWEGSPGRMLPPSTRSPA
jgi:hypothetical protein